MALVRKNAENFGKIPVLANYFLTFWRGGVELFLVTLCKSVYRLTNLSACGGGRGVRRELQFVPARFPPTQKRRRNNFLGGWEDEKKNSIVNHCLGL